MADRKKIIIDTDPGIDDALALILSLNSPEIEIQAVTTVCGNVPVQLATKNVFSLLSFMNIKTPPKIASGSKQPLKEAPAYAHHVHGSDGLGGLNIFKDLNTPHIDTLPEATGLISEIVSRHPGEVTLVMLGPLTNLALLLQNDEAAAKKIKEVIIMGGAVFVPGNITPHAEFNIYHDPHAAKAVLGSGLNITLVGLDVTTKCTLERKDLYIREIPKTRLNLFTSLMLGKYLDFYKEKRGIPFCHLHDPLAAAIAIKPKLVTTKLMNIDVSLDKETKGKTFENKTSTTPPTTRVCIDVDHEKFKKLFIERVLVVL
jgi:inosine-uridine nucleoside N-ribohydrolase